MTPRQFQVLSIASAMAQGSSHPLSISLTAATARLGLPAFYPPTLPCGAPALTTTVFPGKGFTLTTSTLAGDGGGKMTLALGSPAWLFEEGGVVGCTPPSEGDECWEALEGVKAGVGGGSRPSSTSKKGGGGGMGLAWLG